jgi:hypothetical protein
VVLVCGQLWLFSSELSPFTQSLSTLLATLIGVFITAGASIWINYRREQREEMNARADEDAFLKAVLEEMEVVFERYDQYMKEKVEALKPGEFLTMESTSNDDLFPLYHSNAHRIGLISRDQLRLALVRLRTLAIVMIGQLQANTALLERRRRIIRLPGANNRNKELEEMNGRLDWMAMDIKRLHYELEQARREFLDEISNHFGVRVDYLLADRQWTPEQMVVNASLRLKPDPIGQFIHRPVPRR